MCVLILPGLYFNTVHFNPKLKQYNHLEYTVFLVRQIVVNILS